MPSCAPSADRRWRDGHESDDDQAAGRPAAGERAGLPAQPSRHRRRAPAPGPARAGERHRRELSRRPQVKGPATAPAQAFVTQRLAQLLDRAERERTALKDDYLSVEHVLLAIVDESAPVIRDLGLTREKLMS